LNISPFLLVSIVILSFSSAENKSITELGNLQIEDLFYNSESTLISADIEKTSKNNEDFGLESLEINDIDIATFGEYENFLNKYYDDNFIDINSRFIRQIKFNPTLIFGNSMPHLWPSLSNKYSSGLYIGTALELYSNYFGKKEIVLDGELYLTTMASTTSIYENFLIYNILCNVSIDLSKKFKLKIGIGQSPTTQGTFNTLKGGLIYRLPINALDFYLSSYAQFTTGVPYTLDSENKKSIFFGFNLIFKPSSIIINY